MNDAGESLLDVGSVAGAVAAADLRVTTAWRMACSARQLGGVDGRVLRWADVDLSDAAESSSSPAATRKDEPADDPRREQVSSPRIRFQSPLVESDMQISRIRLSDEDHAFSSPYVAQNA